MTPQELVDELCDAVDNDDMCYRSYLVGEVEDLCAENAKLRELVRHLRECTRHNVCAACEYADDVCDFDYDMHELGVDE